MNKLELQILAQQNQINALTEQQMGLVTIVHRLLADFHDFKRVLTAALQEVSNADGELTTTTEESGSVVREGECDSGAE